MLYVSVVETNLFIIVLFNHMLGVVSYNFKYMQIYRYLYI